MYRGNRARIVLSLAALVASGQLIGQDDPRWQVTPNVNALDDWSVQPSSTALAKAMNDAAEYVVRFKVPASADDWAYRRPQVDRALRVAIGLPEMPERTPLRARTTAVHDRGAYRLENVVFESRPGFPVTAHLYRPKDTGGGGRAAVLCPIGHILDVGKADEDVQSRCIQLVRMGFVVLSYDAIGHGERLISGNIHHEAQYALLPLGETVTGWMVWDSLRAIDYLSSLPDVDPRRIGVTGNSGGGLNTLYTAALDSRVAASSIVGYTFHFRSWMKYAGAHGSCSQLIGLYRQMEWFEIAGLIAPRAVQMIQGERDNIFPVSSARTAGRGTEALYTVLGHRDRARLDIIPGLGHAYSRPYRERMYGWMARHLLGEGDGGPLAEGELDPLPESDARLRCDPDGSVMAASGSVVALARSRGRAAVEALPLLSSPGRREAVRAWLADLNAPPDEEPHHLMPRRVDRTEMEWCALEKVFFVSEIGQHIPGLLWLPKSPARPRATVIIVDDRGKGAVAESDLVRPLVEAGLAVLAVDLRGRGETLGRISHRADNNYHFVLHSILWGRPPAGRRAFDLKRAIDFVSRRADLPDDDLVVVGLGDDALPALLAAASDERIGRLVCSDFYSSFTSQMIAAALTGPELLRQWNSSANRWGRIQGESYRVDLGSVIPSVLDRADIPELVALVAPRPVLYCQTRDREESLHNRFREVTGGVEGSEAGWLSYRPDTPLSAAGLLRWLED